MMRMSTDSFMYHQNLKKPFQIKYMIVIKLCVCTLVEKSVSLGVKLKYLKSADGEFQEVFSFFM